MPTWTGIKAYIILCFLFIREHIPFGVSLITYKIPLYRGSSRPTLEKPGRNKFVPSHSPWLCTCSNVYGNIAVINCYRSKFLTHTRTCTSLHGECDSGSFEANSEIMDTEGTILQTHRKLPDDVHSTSTNMKKMETYTARFANDNGLVITYDEEGRVIAIPGSFHHETNNLTDHKQHIHVTQKNKENTQIKQDTTHESSFVSMRSSVQTPSQSSLDLTRKRRPTSVTEQIPRLWTATDKFNVVLTHCTADFDSLASAVGLAKLWSTPSVLERSSQADHSDGDDHNVEDKATLLPTFVVLPRGAHPSVQKFLALHEHVFPIRSLRSLPADLSNLYRLGLVDAQRRERVGPAEHLLSHAKRVTVVDHHVDGDSDIPEATDYIVDKVGSVSTMVVEFLQNAGIELSEAEATLLALGIHADTGSLCFDSATTRDAKALAWVMGQGASQTAIAEHVRSSLSQEQQNVLTQALISTNSTVIHGVTLSTVLLRSDGFINGLAAVTQDALELSSSDVFILAMMYDAKSGSKGKMEKRGPNPIPTARLQTLLLKSDSLNSRSSQLSNNTMADAWKGGDDARRKAKLRVIFDRMDLDGSGFLERDEVYAAIVTSGVITSKDNLESLIESMDRDGDGRINFEEFVTVSNKLRVNQTSEEIYHAKRAPTMTVIGRAKAGVNIKTVNLHKLFSQYGGGGHAKAASCTIRLRDENEAAKIIQSVVDELIATSLMKQPTVGDFMTSPVLSAKPYMTEKQVEDLFTRYDVRALPVVDDKNNVIGLVTYKEVAAAKQRLWNKAQKRLKDDENKVDEKTSHAFEQRKLGSALKGWMKHHVQTVEASMTMAEVENVLLENDDGCIPVVADGTKQLVGLVTRTDILRQHRYYPSLYYNNKGFSDSIAARKPIIELRKKLKKFDLDE